MADIAFTSYDALLDGVREILSSADVGRHRDRGRRKACLYWQLGDAIHTHLLHHQARAKYGEGLFGRLSEDLRMDVTTLYLTVECRRALPFALAAAHSTRTASSRQPPLPAPAATWWWTRALASVGPALSTA